MAKFKFGALAVLWTLIGPAATFAAGKSPTGWSEFRQSFETYAKADKMVGGSALLFFEGRVAERLHYGYADREARRPVTDRTIFHWASITKTLTAIAIMQLRDRGKLALDDSATKWLSELRLLHDPYGMVDKITVRMLLNHSAGFPVRTWPWKHGLPWEPFEPTTWEQLVAMMPYQELLFKPGSRFGYSNPGFIYLGRIVETLTGDPWSVYVQKNIFTPLGLSDSHFGTTPYHLAADRSHNYSVRWAPDAGTSMVVDNGSDFDPGITMPNGGWNSSLSDLAAYLAFLMSSPPDKASRQLYDVVLPRSTLEEMWRPALQVTGIPSFDWVGFSFFGGKREGTTYVGHTGHQAGFQAYMYFNPAKRIAVAWAFNTANENQSREAKAAHVALTSAALSLLQ